MDAAFDALETASRCLADAKDQVEASPPDEAKLAAAQQQLAFLQMQACTFAFEVSQLQAILQSKSAGFHQSTIENPSAARKDTPPEASARPAAAVPPLRTDRGTTAAHPNWGRRCGRRAGISPWTDQRGERRRLR